MTVTAVPVPSRGAAWRAAIRLPTLPAAAAPVIAGSALAYADEVFRAGPALAALAGALLLQIGANLANDAFDFKRGADTPDRLGPPRAVASGWLTHDEVMRGMWLTFALAAIAGVYLTVEAGWPVLVIGIAGILCAMAYTGGPWALGYHGLGDAATFLFFGPIAVSGTYFVQADDLTGMVLLASAGIGFAVTAILVVNNLRDLETDRRAGKRTLGVLMGDRATRLWYVVLVVAAFAMCVAVVVRYEAAWAVLLLLPVPLAVRLSRVVLGGTRGRALNPALKQSAQLALVLSVAFSLAVALSRVG